jgi:septum formation protein
MSELLFVLASASPARRAILIQAGIDPFIAVSNFDESQITTTEPIELVQTLAKCKAEAVRSRFSQQQALILGCDSVMVVDDEIFGKPIYKDLAIAMWDKMRGRKGLLYTGHCLIDTKNQRMLTRSGITIVHFANATDAEIISYIDTGEPLNCAGCCTLEGLGGFLIEGLEGCHTNVLGLSLPLLREMIRELGYKLRFKGDKTGHKTEISPIP